MREMLLDDIAQIKRKLDDLVSSLNRRLTSANERKLRAEHEIASCTREIAVISKALVDIKPLQGHYGATAAAVRAVESVAKRGSNRTIIIDILTAQGCAMTNGEIAKIAYEQGKIKSKKGQKGVYATVATALSRGKNVFINNSGQWDLRARRIKPTEGPFSLIGRLGVDEAARVLAGKIDA